MKQSEIISLSASELNLKLSELKKSYTELKTAHAITPIENPLRIRLVRRAVARVATELSKRELQ
jgi:large subunit ribosomal protein L29